MDTSNSVITATKTSFIDVAVATLWASPTLSRPVDIPSLTNPVDLWTWTRSMTVDQKNWLMGKIQAQAFLGTKVTITAVLGDWTKISFFRPHNYGYSGWLPTKQLRYDATYEQKSTSGPYVIITTPTTILYDTPFLDREYMEISINTQLPLLKEDFHYNVLLPNGTKAWVRKEDGRIVTSLPPIQPVNGEMLVQTAKQFQRLPYLWAGSSGFGFDCSGFTSTVYQAWGIYLPRTSALQGTIGTPIKKEDLQKGDLIFFAYQNGTGSIHHVAMYYGDGLMIHSPNSSKSVEVIRLETRGYIEEYAGARRYTTNQQNRVAHSPEENSN